MQTCPKVLRQTVSDLFPYRNLENCELSVITISLKPDLKSLRKNKEIETEKLAQTVSYGLIYVVTFSYITFSLVCIDGKKYL